MSSWMGDKRGKEWWPRGDPAPGMDGGSPSVGCSDPAEREGWAESSSLRPPALLWGLPAPEVWVRGAGYGLHGGRGAGMAGVG